GEFLLRAVRVAGGKHWHADQNLALPASGPGVVAGVARKARILVSAARHQLRDGGADQPAATLQKGKRKRSSHAQRRWLLVSKASPRRVEIQPQRRCAESLRTRERVNDAGSSEAGLLSGCRAGIAAWDLLGKRLNQLFGFGL